MNAIKTVVEWYIVSCPNCICMYMFVSLEYYPLTALPCQPVGQGSTYNSDCNKVNIHYSSNQNLIQIHNLNKVITAPLSPPDRESPGHSQQARHCLGRWREKRKELAFDNVKT